MQPAEAPSLGRAWALLSASALVSRLLPFAASVAAARRLSPESFGVSSVHFSLVGAAVVVVREPARRWAARSPSSLPFVWLVVPCGALIGLLVLCAVHFALSPTSVPFYELSVALHALAAVGELSVEPSGACLFFVAPSAALRLRAAADAASSLVRSLVLVFLPSASLPPALVFAASRCAATAALCATHFACLRRLRRQLPALQRAPANAAAEWRLRPPTPELAILSSLAWQAACRAAGAEGQRVAAAALLRSRAGAPSSAGGAIGTYALAASLTSLPQKLVVTPLCQAWFASLAAAASLPPGKGAETSGTALTEAQRRSDAAALLRGVLALWLFTAAFAPSLAPVLLSALYGTKWSAQPGAARTVALALATFPLTALASVADAHAAATERPGPLRGGSQARLAASLLASFALSSLLVRCTTAGAAGMVFGQAAGAAASLGLYAMQARRDEQSGAGVICWADVAPRGRTVALVCACGALAARGYAPMAAAAAAAASVVQWEGAALRSAGRALFGNDGERARHRDKRN